MKSCSLTLLFVFFFFSCLLHVCRSSPGDQDPIYRTCVEKCEKTGCIDDKCFVNCKLAINGDDQEETGKSKCPYDAWMQWDCRSECRYQCMILRETNRSEDGQSPIKYHGKWPIVRMFGLQEPFSVFFSIGNFVAHAQGLWSFIHLVYFKLPKRPQGKMGPYYEYSDIWILYGMASLNSWFWSVLFHGRYVFCLGFLWRFALSLIFCCYDHRDTTFTERLDYSSAIALLGLALIIAIIRSLNLRIEATRVMVAAPVIAFIATHILYMNFYEFDYGWNIKVCVTVGLLQGLVWTVWAGYTGHPSKAKLWFVVLAGLLTMFLEIFDFPPILGSLDAHSLWHAATIPLSLLWWSFVKDDALFRTKQLLRKADIAVDSKKVQ